MDDRPDPARTAAAIARMARGASIEVSVRSPQVVSDCAQWLAPGTEVFISMVPGQTYHQSAQLAHALARAGFVPVPHVTARTLVDTAMAGDVFARLAGAGARRVLVLGGDRAVPAGHLDSALALLQSGALAGAAVERVYMAGYPDGHPAIPEAVLEEHLARKLALCAERGWEAGVVTQFTFEAQRLGDWLDRVAARHPGVRLVASAAGPAGVGTLLRYAARCGVRASLDTFARHADRFLRVLSDAGPEALVHALAQREAAGAAPTDLHLFSFGGTARTARWRRAVAAGAFDLHPAGDTFAVRPV
ncbi:MAG: hypothetical protein JNM90_25835 [Burkholderiales bacterium]|nr:hypothetical protein [Burkholderiales bacterium]